jgi:hypothetical protein
MNPSVSPQGETGWDDAAQPRPHQVKHDQGWSESQMSNTNRCRPNGNRRQTDPPLPGDRSVSTPAVRAIRQSGSAPVAGRGAAVQFDAYQTVPTIFQDLVRVTSSNKYEELYAPLYNSELPVEILPSEPFPDSRILGLDIHVRNRKWGRMLTFERELVDDDMTGQISQRAANLGQMMRYIEELQVMIALVESGRAKARSALVRQGCPEATQDQMHMASAGRR